MKPPSNKLSLARAMDNRDRIISAPCGEVLRHIGASRAQEQGFQTFLLMAEPINLGIEFKNSAPILANHSLHDLDSEGTET